MGPWEDRDAVHAALVVAGKAHGMALVGGQHTEQMLGLLQALDSCVKAGKIRFCGLSNETPWGISQYLKLSAQHNLPRMVSIQNEFGPLHTKDWPYLIEQCVHENIAYLPWSPLAGGFLTGKYRGGDDNNRASKLGMLVHAEKSARETALLDTLLAVAAELDASPTHVAIAWLLEKARRSTTALIPILGSRSREQLDATLGALSLALTAQQVARLEAVSAVEAGVPHGTIIGSAPRYSGVETLDWPVVPVA